MVKKGNKSIYETTLWKKKRKTTKSKEINFIEEGSVLQTLSIVLHEETRKDTSEAKEMNREIVCEKQVSWVSFKEGQMPERVRGQLL